MYLSLIFLPLIGAILSNRWNGNIYGPILSTITMLITLIITLILFYEVALNSSPVILELGKWINYGTLSINWDYNFDVLTVSMLLPVITISFFVQLYSLNYMSNDPHIVRFFSYLSIFTFFMLLLITGDNLLILFLGWEGVGLASYLLINFWFTRIAANFAALKAFLVNRVGDWGFMLGIILILVSLDDLSLSTIMVLAHLIHPDLILIIVIFLMIGAMAKSAQFGLHSWLADAMEGPTPVSALIHAATMVTAGVYLLMRISPLIEWSNEISLFIIWLGGLSALLGAACGLLENDLKKVIAFSTTSQLGYMIVACGISQYSISLFHLINHAFFKALLFLSAGAVLHAVVDEQDMRKFGGLQLLLPITYISFIIGSLSLMAFPFLTGFYSKDFLLEILLIPHNFSHTIAYILTLIAAFLTSIYSIRLLIMTFLSKPNISSKEILHYIIDPELYMMIPLILLSLGAIFFGYITHELFLAFGSEFYLNSLFTHPDNIRLFDGTLSQSSILKYTPLLTLLFIISLLPLKIINKQYNNTYQVNNNIVINDLWWMTRILNSFNIYQTLLCNLYLKYSTYLYRYWDKGLLQILGPYGIYRFIHFQSFKLELLSTSYILHYAIILILVTILISFIYIFYNEINILILLILMIGYLLE